MTQREKDRDDFRIYCLGVVLGVIIGVYGTVFVLHFP
jgi:hypothetical protein